MAVVAPGQVDHEARARTAAIGPQREAERGGAAVRREDHDLGPAGSHAEDRPARGVVLAEPRRVDDVYDQRILPLRQPRKAAPERLDASWLERHEAGDDRHDAPLGRESLQRLLVEGLSAHGVVRDRSAVDPVADDRARIGEQAGIGREPAIHVGRPADHEERPGRKALDALLERGQASKRRLAREDLAHRETQALAPVPVRAEEAQGHSQSQTGDQHSPTRPESPDERLQTQRGQQHEYRERPLRQLEYVPGVAARVLPGIEHGEGEVEDPQAEEHAERAESAAALSPQRLYQAEKAQHEIDRRERPVQQRPGGGLDARPAGCEHPGARRELEELDGTPGDVAPGQVGHEVAQPEHDADEVAQAEQQEESHEQGHERQEGALPPAPRRTPPRMTRRDGGRERERWEERQVHDQQEHEGDDEEHGVAGTPPRRPGRARQQDQAEQGDGERVGLLQEAVVMAPVERVRHDGEDDRGAGRPGQSQAQKGPPDEKDRDRHQDHAERRGRGVGEGGDGRACRSLYQGEQVGDAEVVVLALPQAGDVSHRRERIEPAGFRVAVPLKPLAERAVRVGVVPDREAVRPEHGQVRHERRERRRQAQGEPVTHAAARP